MVKPRIFINTIKIEVKLNISARTFSFFMKLGNILKQQWAFTVPEARKKNTLFFNVIITIVCNVNKSINIGPLNEILCVHCLFRQLAGNFHGSYLVQDSVS